MLYPRENEVREIKDLSGIWEFKTDKDAAAILMPVPSSYNDITQDASIRDHAGDAWYERSFFIPGSWKGRRVVIRAGSVTHHGVISINGQEAVRHKGGYLPFEADITGMVDFGGENRVTITVNNVLDWTTLPPGEIRTFQDGKHPDGYRVQEYFHDFYNYAGIHRPVILYTTPPVFIGDIDIDTDIAGRSGIIRYNIKLSEDGAQRAVKVKLIDRGKEIGSNTGRQGEFTIERAHFWEPGKSYLYCLRIETYNNGALEDIYSQPAGIRTVKVSGKQFLINGKPFYFKGFGKHEDMDIAGKGLNNALNVKDINLMKWIGANSFRTSHYPYSEEFMELADSEGFAVIDETPAVGLNLWDMGKKVFCEERVHEDALEHHLQVIRELVGRDKNRPSVVMWSLANEASTYEEGALPYFRKLAEETRKLDPARPITIAQSSHPGDCKVAGLFDVICVNRYYSWYEDPGRLELIEFQIERELREWYDNFKQPVLMSEYGADSVPGLHHDPAVMFSEEYQCELLEHYHNVFDKLDFIIGEHVWNFADFATKQGITRVDGNRKGVFTRQRQPKAAAHLLRKRWL
ncbi:MAG: beta-glucuronidase [Brevinematales bacterium]|jgi:beta-glucuronidase